MDLGELRLERGNLDPRTTRPVPPTRIASAIVEMYGLAVELMIGTKVETSKSSKIESAHNSRSHARPMCSQNGNNLHASLASLLHR